MRKLYVVCLVCFCFGICQSEAQTITSVQDGAWNDPTTWGGTVPTSTNSSLIQIENAVNVPNGYSVTVDQVFVDISATLTIDAGGILTVANGTGTDLDFYNDGFDYGFFVVNGTVICNDLATILDTDTNNANFQSGSTYTHLYTGTEGSIPVGNWDANSTIQILGYTTTITASAAGNWNQSFGNFIFNCTSLAANKFVDYAGTLTSVQTDLTIAGTGTSGSFRFGSTQNPTILVGRDLTISGTARVLIASGTATVVNVGRNFNYNSTNATGSNLTTTGKTTLNVVNFNMNASGGKLTLASSGAGNGIINCSGNFTLNAGTIITGSSSSTINFIGSSLQTFVNTGTISGPTNFTMANLSIVDLGIYPLTGTGTLTLNPSSTLKVGSTDAAGAIQIAGTGAGNVQTSSRSYSTSSNIIYDGSGLQRLGAGFPSSSVNLEIANSSGVINNNIGVTNVVGNLTLTAGSFSIGASNTLNIQSNFVVTGGTIGGDPTANLSFSGSGTIGIVRFSSGAQTINNLSNSRTSTIVLGSDLTVSGNINLSAGSLDFSAHTLTMNGGLISSGGTPGLISSSTSSLVFGGSTYSGGIPFNGAGNQLNNLTFATPGGSFTWNSPVVINNTLTLSNGALTNTSGITMAANSTFIYGVNGTTSGSFTGTSPTAVTSYNVIYTGTGTTGLELPSSATALNNLTINTSGTVTLGVSGITVNGTLTIAAGTFDAGSNNVTLNGNFVSNSSSLLTSSTLTFAGTSVVSGSIPPIFGTIIITGSFTPSANFEIDGNLINNGTMMAGSSTTTFGGNTTLSGSSTDSFNNIDITGTLVAPSGASSFNVAGDFLNNGTFTNNGSIVNFNGTSTVGGSAASNFASLTITGTLTSPSSLNIANSFTNNGNFSAAPGTTVNFNGTSIQQQITGSSVTNFQNITVTNVVGAVATPTVQVQSNQNLLGVLTLGSTSFFDADGSAGTSVFTLVSSADGSNFLNTKTSDASIAPIPAGAAVTGNVTVQRYMSIEGSNSDRIYRYISSPVQNAPVSQIQTTVPVTGTFTGASSCSGCLTNASMFRYDETVAGDLNVGYVNFPVASNSEVLATGLGYALYERGNIDPIATAGSGTWSVTGSINAANVAPIVFPLTYTAQNGPADDGWNLIGNPFPSTIDWNASSGWTKSSDLSSTIYITDNAAGPSADATVVATWNGVAGTNGGSQYIATGAGFFVQSDGSATPSLIATENVKAAGTQTIFFRQAAPSNLLRVTMAQNGKTDEAIIHFRADATDNFDNKADAYKLKNTIFNLSSISNKQKLAINSLPDLSCTRIVNLSITDATPGSYQLNFSNMTSFNSSVKILLHDTKGSADWIDISSKSSYDFDVTTDTTTFGSNRFSVSFGYSNQLPVALSIAAAGTCSTNDSKVTISNSSSSLNYVANINGNAVTPITPGNGKDLTLTVSKDLLKFGANSVEIIAQSPNCSTLTYSQNVSVQVDSIYTVTSPGAKSCLAGSVLLRASGAPIGGTYNWYAENTDNTVEFTGSEFTTTALQKTKTFYVAAVNTFGCEGPRIPVVATVVNFSPATITTLNGTTLQSNYAFGNKWFLDEDLLADTTAVLKPTANGTYKLLVSVAGCSTFDEKTFTITGLGEANNGIQAYPNPVGGNSNIYHVEIPDAGNDVSELAVLNSMGTKIGAIQLSSDGDVKKGQYDFSSQSSGLYFIKVSNGSTVTVLKIIKK